MSRLTILLLIVLTYQISLAEQFQIFGNIRNLPDQWVSLTFMDDSLHSQVDSVYAFNGKFMFQGSLAEATAGGLYTADGKITVTFFFEPGLTQITGDTLWPSGVMVQGGNSTSDYNNYKVFEIPLIEQTDSLREVAFAHSNDSVAFQKYWAVYSEALRVKLQKQDGWMMEHNNSAVCAYYFLYHYMDADNLTKGDSLLRLTTEKVQGSKYSRTRKKVIRNTVLREVGRPVKHFTQNDTSGKSVSTQIFSGKYFLIDFWASWCKPCRDESPTLVKAYRAYHDQGFEIISVSLDNSKDSWKAAIAKDSLTWTHVSELKAENSAAELYDVHSLPANFLVDKNGIIIGKLLRGRQLMAKLEEVF